MDVLHIKMFEYWVERRAIYIHSLIKLTRFFHFQSKNYRSFARKLSFKPLSTLMEDLTLKEKKCLTQTITTNVFDASCNLMADRNGKSRRTQNY